MYRPLGKNVIVSVIDGGKETESGIILHTSIEPDRGLVVAVGNEVTQLSVGDQVFMDWNKTIKLENEELWLISEDNIVWVYEDV
jgi:co-chaperonin GroES (HSP10)